MSGSLAGLLAANVLYLAIGVGALPLLRIARTREELVSRLGLAYLGGVVVSGILAAHLSLIGLPIDLAALAVLAAPVVFFGVRRLRRAQVSDTRTRLPGTVPSIAASAVALAAVAVLLVHAWRTYAVRPLLEWDGWAIWATKARALYEFGGATGPVFTTDAYAPLQHPLFLPALEAVGFRAMGAYDPTLIHVQLLLLAVGFVGALWSLLRPLVPAFLLAAVMLAVLAAEPVLKQLATNHADVPLAFLLALGVTALARWLVDGESWLLVCAALFLGAATLTKSEGAMFVLAAFLALGIALVGAGRARLRPPAVTALAVALLLGPWRLFVTARDLPVAEYRFGNLVSPGYLSDHADRVAPAAGRLLGEMLTLEWGLVVPLAVVALASSLLSRRYRLSGFVSLWAALSFAGLVLIYWISNLPIELTLTWSADRTVVSIVVALGALAPLLATEAASGRR